MTILIRLQKAKRKNRKGCNRKNKRQSGNRKDRRRMMNKLHHLEMNKLHQLEKKFAEERDGSMTIILSLFNILVPSLSQLTASQDDDMSEMVIGTHDDLEAFVKDETNDKYIMQNLLDSVNRVCVDSQYKNKDDYEFCDYIFSKEGEFIDHVERYFYFSMKVNMISFYKIVLKKLYKIPNAKSLPFQSMSLFAEFVEKHTHYDELYDTIKKISDVVSKPGSISKSVKKQLRIISKDVFHLRSLFDKAQHKWNPFHFVRVR